MTRNILVSGGSGAFGQTFIRRWLAQTEFDGRIVIFSRNEKLQWEMRERFKADYGERIDRERLRFFIGDVRDLDRLIFAFSDIHYVVHAAALKRIEAAEYDPTEFAKTNILGSWNVITAAVRCGVKKVMGISSDKSAASVNLYGKTKAVMESLFSSANVYSDKTRFSCVRYGNVINSTGSVIPLWREQSKNGGKISVTNAQMTRFLITLEQGADFVIDCLAKMHGGEIFIPKLTATSVDELARAYRPLSEWEVMGLRPGEKMNELLLSADESPFARDHGDRFVIYPRQIEWAGLNVSGSPLVDGFQFSSTSAPRANSEQLRELLKGL